MTSHQVEGFVQPGEGELAAVDVDGTPVVVTVVDGQLYAFDEECTHAGCPLTSGFLEGHAVVCPCHFGKFDIRTGAVLDGPPPSGIRTWAARLTDGTLELDAEDGGAPSRPASSSSAEDASASAAPDADRDITVLIENEHEGFRRQFERVEGLSEPQELQEAWATLAERLEVHASGEESVLYPHLVRAADSGPEEAEHAVRDHNEIRDSVRAVEQHEVGSDAWREAVRTAQRVNEDHLQEEERDVLPDFRDSVDRARRDELGRQWLTFQDEHEGARGLSGEHKDPQAYVEQHER